MQRTVIETVDHKVEFVGHHRRRSGKFEGHKMRFCIATAFYATVFAAMYISSGVFASKTWHCFSCHGYDKDNPTKCLSREGRELFVKKCTANSPSTPACIKYTGLYKVPQLMGDQLKQVPSEAHGVHCGTFEGCARNECPNELRKDISVENCRVTCCQPNGTCSFPLPTPYEVNQYNLRQVEKGRVDALAIAGKRSSGATRISRSLWLQSAGFALVAWFRF